jgi:hypothetical protein
LTIILIMGGIKLFTFYQRIFRDVNSQVCRRNVMFTAHSSRFAGFVQDAEYGGNS